MFRVTNSILTISAVLVLSASAFGWGGPSHSVLAENLLYDPVISPLIPGDCSVSTVINFTGEPPDEWHHPGWAMIRDRGYLGTYSGQDWTSLDQTTRVKYLIHIATDCGVPVGHSPANDVWSDTIKEAALEAQVATWSDYPSIVGTSSFTHSRNGYSKTFNGTRSQIMTKYYDTAINAANWAKDNLGVPLFDYNDYRAAGWNGTTLGQFLGRVMLADLFLAEQPTIANANGNYAVNPGGSVTFSSAGSQDPDSISWNSSGSYSNNGGGINCSWDLNNDGTYETSGASPNLSHSQLVSLVGYTEGTTVNLRVADDEPSAYQSTAYDTATLAVYSNPTAAGKAHYGWLGKAGDVPTGWDWDYLEDDGSDDADGGGITNWQWDLDNNGSFDKSGGSSVMVYYTDFQSRGITANENHTVTLRVTDNEGKTETISGISMPILVNPTCDVDSASTAWQGGSPAHFDGSGSDPDGGGISQYRWDIDNDGVWDLFTDSATLSYEELTGSYNLAPSQSGHLVRFGVVDNDADITGWWAGEAEETTTVYIYSLPTADALETYALEPGSSVDFSATGEDADGGDILQWLWDLDGDGQYDDLSGTGSLTYDQLIALGLSTGEWLTIGLKVVDNEGQVGYDSALLALYPSILGDANLDGAVDPADYTIFADNYGTGNSWNQADFNLDGYVDPADYTIFADNYGRTGASSPTPEPAGMSLLAVGLVFLKRRRG
ncbi:MAG: hypothetical protein JW849_09170 [Phycisphaerae bacterium]|nr:hypothetical protein [Phycisphaerae bacterium]